MTCLLMSTYVFTCTSKDDLTAEPAVQLCTVSAAAASLPCNSECGPQYEDFIPCCPRSWRVINKQETLSLQKDLLLRGETRQDIVFIHTCYMLPVFSRLVAWLCVAADVFDKIILRSSSYLGNIHKSEQFKKNTLEQYTFQIWYVSSSPRQGEMILYILP